MDQRRTDVHIKLTQTKIFKTFAAFAQSTGASYNPEIYKNTLKEAEKSQNSNRSVSVKQPKDKNLHHNGTLKINQDIKKDRSKSGKPTGKNASSFKMIK